MSIPALSPIRADLHVHSRYSDGSLGLDELVQAATATGLVCISITDHDTVDAYHTDSWKSSLSKPWIDFRTGGTVVENFLLLIPGIEISTRDIPERNFLDIHILGYGIDPKNSVLTEELLKINEARFEQKCRVIEILRTGFGYNITYDEVAAKAEGTIGKPHIVETILDKFGLVGQERKTYKEKLYTLLDREAHVEKGYLLTIGQAIEMIHGSGGLAVLAHPGLYENDVEAVEYAFSNGIDGIEAYYAYDYSPFMKDIKPHISGFLIDRYVAMADERGLFISGGSDFHGKAKDIAIGDGGLWGSGFDSFISRLRK